MAKFSDKEAQDLAADIAKVNNPSELEDWMMSYLKDAGKLPDDKSNSVSGSNISVSQPVKVTIPERLSLSAFSGGSKDTSYDLWRYEVDCVKGNSFYTPQQTFNAVRKSLRGEAARVSMRLGVTASLDSLLSKLEDTFGLLSSKHYTMKDFYSSFQGPKEDVFTWSNRLEELIDQAKKLGRVEEKDENQILWNSFVTD